MRSFTIDGCHVLLKALHSAAIVCCSSDGVKELKATTVDLVSLNWTTVSFGDRWVPHLNAKLLKPCRSPETEKNAENLRLLCPSPNLLIPKLHLSSQKPPYWTGNGPIKTICWRPTEANGSSPRSWNTDGKPMLKRSFRLELGHKISIRLVSRQSTIPPGTAMPIRVPFDEQFSLYENVVTPVERARPAGSEPFHFYLYFYVCIR